MDKRRIGVRAIIYKDGTILAVKHKRKDGSVADFWAIPGGGLDPGESLEDGLRRELQEELGVDVQPGRLLFVQQFRSSRTDRDEELEFFFLVEYTDDLAAVDFMQASHGADELARCEFIDPTREFVLPRFISTIPLQTYVDSVQPVFMTTFLGEGE